MVPFISYWYHDDTTPGIHMITKIKDPLDTLTLPAMQWALLENKNVTPALKRSTTSVISRCRSPATFPTFFFTFQRLSNFSIISFLLLPFQRLSSPPSPQQQQSHVTGSNCVSMLLHGRITILKSRLLKPGAIALWRLQSTLSTPQTAKQRCVLLDNSPTTYSHRTRLFTKNK